MTESKKLDSWPVRSVPVFDIKWGQQGDSPDLKEWPSRMRIKSVPWQITVPIIQIVYECGTDE